MVGFETERCLDGGHVSHHLVNPIGEERANEEMHDRRFKQRRLACGFQLLPCALREEFEFGLRGIMERKFERTFKFDFFAPMVVNEPGLPRKRIRVGRP